MRIDRNEFVEEMMLRESIQKAILFVENKRNKKFKKNKLNEAKLRGVIRKILKEESI